MFLNIFIILLLVWLGVFLLFRREMKRMGGRVPILYGPFTLFNMMKEYRFLCDKAQKSPIYFYILYSLLAAIFIYVIAVIICGLKGWC